MKNKEQEDLLVRLRLESEMKRSEVLAAQIERLERFREDHEKDLTLYEFRCERYGDFLAIFISRGESIEREYYWQEDNTKIISALSLMHSQEIRLVEGYAPNMSGVAYFSERLDNSSGKYYAHVLYDDIIDRPMLVLDKPVDGNVWMIGSESYYERLGVSVEGCARGAKDDTLRLEGGGATIFAPFGKGKMVYEKILEAMKK